MTWLVPLLLLVLGRSTPPTNPTPVCAASDLAARVVGPGGPAAGTFHTPVRVRDVGADCVLPSGGLVLDTGAESARLDLADRGGRLRLTHGTAWDLSATVQDGACVAASSGPPVAGRLTDAEGAAVPLRGRLSPVYGCPGLQLIAAAASPAPAPSRHATLTVQPQGAVPQSPVLTQLAGRADVRRELLGDTQQLGRLVQCGWSQLGASPDQRTTYAWLTCGAWTTGPGASLQSGGSSAVVVRVQGEQVVGVRFPRQSHLDADLDRLFPARIARLVREGQQLPILPTLDQLTAAAASATPSR